MMVSNTNLKLRIFKSNLLISLIFVILFNLNSRCRGIIGRLTVYLIYLKQVCIYFITILSIKLIGLNHHIHFFLKRIFFFAFLSSNNIARRFNIYFNISQVNVSDHNRR